MNTKSRLLIYLEELFIYYMNKNLIYEASEINEIIDAVYKLEEDNYENT